MTMKTSEPHVEWADPFYEQFRAEFVRAARTLSPEAQADLAPLLAGFEAGGEFSLTPPEALAVAGWVGDVVTAGQWPEGRYHEIRGLKMAGALHYAAAVQRDFTFTHETGL